MVTRRRRSARLRPRRAHRQLGPSRIVATSEVTVDDLLEIQLSEPSESSESVDDVGTERVLSRVRYQPQVVTYCVRNSLDDLGGVRHGRSRFVLKAVVDSYRRRTEGSGEAAVGCVDEVPAKHSDSCTAIAVDRLSHEAVTRMRIEQGCMRSEVTRTRLTLAVIPPLLQSVDGRRTSTRSPVASQRSTVEVTMTLYRRSRPTIELGRNARSAGASQRPSAR